MRFVLYKAHRLVLQASIPKDGRTTWGRLKMVIQRYGGNGRNRLSAYLAKTTSSGKGSPLAQKVKNLTV